MVPFAWTHGQLGHMSHPTDATLCFSLAPCSQTIPASPGPAPHPQAHPASAVVPKAWHDSYSITQLFLKGSLHLFFSGMCSEKMEMERGVPANPGAGQPWKLNVWPRTRQPLGLDPALEALQGAQVSLCKRVLGQTTPSKLHSRCLLPSWPFSVSVFNSTLWPPA